jgi:hypothetical protein
MLVRVAGERINERLPGRSKLAFIGISRLVNPDGTAPSRSANGDEQT